MKHFAISEVELRSRMASAMPPLQSLSTFEAAARLGSFAAAAEELGLTPTAVSQRIQLLERHVGAPLFERRARSIALTEWGSAYLPSVVRALEEILGSTAAIFGPRSSSVLTVRAPLSYMSLWLAAATRRFLELHPRIRLRLTTSIWDREALSEEADIDLRLGYGEWSGFDAHLLFRDVVVPVGSPGRLRSSPRIGSVPDLLSHPLIHTMGIEDHWAKLFAKHGARASDAIDGVRVDSSIAAAELASTGFGLALVQRRFLDGYLDASRLLIATQAALRSEKGLYCVLASNRPLRAEAILFRDWLLEECASDPVHEMAV